MNWKKRIIITVLTLILSIPAVTFASKDLNVIESKKLGYIHLHENNCCKKEIPDEVKVKIKELKLKLEKGEITKEQFHKEMKELLPGKTHFKKPGSYKELPEDVKIRLQELKTKLLNGEITEKEFHEEIDKIMPPRIRNMEQRKDHLKKTVE